MEELGYVMLCNVMLCYVMLCYVKLCYVMLSYVIGGASSYPQPEATTTKIFFNFFLKTFFTNNFCGFRLKILNVFLF